MRLELEVVLVVVLVLEVVKEARRKHEERREVRYRRAVSCVSNAWYSTGLLGVEEAMRAATLLECTG